MDGDNNTQQVPGGDPDKDPTDGNPNTPNGKDAILIHYDSDGDGDVVDDDDWCQLQMDPDTGVITPAREPVSDVVGEVVPADVTINATFSVPYIDADGNQQTCTDYTVIESSDGDIEYGNNDGAAWYVVSGDVTINGTLNLRGSISHLILCDGATLTVNQTNNTGGLIASDNLCIYGQSADSGTANITAGNLGIFAINLIVNGGIVSSISTDSTAIRTNYDITINHGSVTADGHYNGIISDNFTVNGGTVIATSEDDSRPGIDIFFNITLGWTNATDRITASSYRVRNGTFSVKDGQALYDGRTAAYSGTLNDAQIAALAGKALQPCFILTLPEHVVATSGVISQEGTMAYALPDAAVTLAPAEGYEITSGDTSFTMPAENVTASVMTQAITYSIFYNLAGGGVATANPETYTVETPTFTLVNPTREHFTFSGWTGTGLAEPTMTVTIAQDSTGNRSYIATWTPNTAEFWGSGDGSQEHPYIITDTIGLDMLATLVNESRLMGKNFSSLVLISNMTTL